MLIQIGQSFPGPIFIAILPLVETVFNQWRKVQITKWHSRVVVLEQGRGKLFVVELHLNGGGSGLEYEEEEEDEEEEDEQRAIIRYPY